MKTIALSLVLALGISTAPACQTLDIPTQTAGCPIFSAGVNRGRVASNEINEASGIAASHRKPGVYYVNNDSGDHARIFAIDERGKNLGTFYLKGAQAIDWEDIAVGPAPGLPGSFIYVADIGDNQHRRKSVVIYRVPEPEISAVQAVGRVDLPGVVALRLQYPDGAAHNAEALLIDPQTADLIIVTKVRNGPAKIFRHPAPHDPTEIAILEEVGSIKLSRTMLPGSAMVTAGDISVHQNQILLRTYSQIFLWQRSPGQSIVEAISRPPCIVPQSPEPQGEAIAWRLDETGYITISEDAHQPIYLFERLSR
jgi:hypothetical protein